MHHWIAPLHMHLKNDTTRVRFSIAQRAKFYMAGAPKFRRCKTGMHMCQSATKSIELLGNERQIGEAMNKSIHVPGK